VLLLENRFIPICGGQLLLNLLTERSTMLVSQMTTANTRMCTFLPPKTKPFSPIKSTKLGYPPSIMLA